jgi:membrane fusion protein (multidrug efflux system)
VVSADASVIAARGDYQKAQADTNRAVVNLGYCKILAPCDGRITNKNVDPGMYVTSANQLFAIVPTDVWVIANFKETQLDLMRPGQPVSIHIDAYPDQDFKGTVQSIQAGTGSRFSVIPAENATGNFVKVVQRVPVKITFDAEVNGADSGELLSPGMSAEPTVRVRDGKF